MSDLHEENEMLKQLLKESTMQEIKKAFSQKEWVWLTDEEIFEHEWWDEETAFAVNKILKEKNA